MFNLSNWQDERLSLEREVPTQFVTEAIRYVLWVMDSSTAKMQSK